MAIRLGSSMKEYGQFCPLAQAAQLLCERWTLLLVRELVAGSTRFSELQKGVPQMSPTLLSTRIKQLVQYGIVERNGERNSSTYTLTPAGLELRGVVELMGAWGHRWARTQLDENDLDAGLLMWDMRRSIDASVFPIHRIVVHFIYHDAPRGSQQWWLVSENNEIDLCLDDPQFEVDLIIKSSLATMTAVWTCQKEFSDEQKRGSIEVLGDPKLSNKLQQWLQSSLLSRLGSLQELPKINWPDSI